MTNPPRKPSTPGDILREEYMKPLNITRRVLAEATGLPEGSIGALLQGRIRVSYEMAVRLSRYLGTTPDFWLSLQTGVDAYVLKSDSFKMRQIDSIVSITEPIPAKPHSAGAGRPCSRK